MPTVRFRAVPGRDNEEVASSKQPRTLILLDPSIFEQVAAARSIVDRVLVASEVAAVSLGTDGLLAPEFVRWLTPNSREHRRWELYADVIVCLDQTVPNPLRSTRQHVFVLVDHGGFVRSGLPYEQPAELAGRVGTPRVSATVHSSPEALVTSDGTAVITCTREGAETAIGGFSSSILDCLTPRRRCVPVVVICLAGRRSDFLPDELLHGLRLAAERSELDVVLFADTSPDELSLGRIPFTHLAPSEQFADATDPTDRCAVAVAPDLEAASRAGIRYPVRRTLLPPVTKLLGQGWAAGGATEPLRQLAEDPTTFLRGWLQAEVDQATLSATRLAIIIPHYNTALAVLSRAIGSALDCRSFHPATEVIVVDDGSAEDLAGEFAEHFGDRWASVRYFRKENEGVGLTRNFAVGQTAADYVFFLDSDDVVVAPHVEDFMRVAVALDADAVVGKRLLVDEDGTFLSDSMNYVFGALFRRVVPGEAVVADDQMATNKIVRRSHLVEKELWFRAGAFEDNEFAAKLYNSSERIFLLNLPLHLWYQYGIGQSITKSPTIENASDKLASLDRAWVHLSPSQRTRRLSFNLQRDLSHVLANSEGPQPLRTELFRRAAAYVASRWRYLRSTDLPAIRSLRSTTVLAPPRDDAVGWVEPMTGNQARVVFFPQTLFDVVSTLLYKLETSETVVAALDLSAVGLDARLVETLESADILDETWAFNGPVYTDLARIRLTQGSSGVSTILDALYRQYHSELGLRVNDSDRCVSFMDGLPEQYFMDRRFRERYRFQDGRQSTLGLQGIGSSFDVWADVREFLKRCDSLGLRTEQPTTRLSLNSNVPRNALAGDRSADARIEPFPFDELFHKHREPLSRFFDAAFGPIPAIAAGVNVVLTQPLYRNYCTLEEHLAVVARLAALAGDGAVLKPHPADECEYSSLAMQVVPAQIPLEYLEIAGYRFGHAYSFGSSTAGAVERHHKLFDREEFGETDVREAITEIANEFGALALPETRRLILENSTEEIPPTPSPYGLRQSLRQIMRPASIALTAVALAFTDRTLFRARLAARNAGTGRPPRR